MTDYKNTDDKKNSQIETKYKNHSNRTVAAVAAITIGTLGLFGASNYFMNDKKEEPNSYLAKKPASAMVITYETDTSNNDYKTIPVSNNSEDSKKGLEGKIKAPAKKDDKSDLEKAAEKLEEKGKKIEKELPGIIETYNDATKKTDGYMTDKDPKKDYADKGSEDPTKIYNGMVPEYMKNVKKSEKEQTHPKKISADKPEQKEPKKIIPGNKEPESKDDKLAGEKPTYNFREAYEKLPDFLKGFFTLPQEYGPQEDTKVAKPAPIKGSNTRDRLANLNCNFYIGGHYTNSRSTGYEIDNGFGDVGFRLGEKHGLEANGSFGKDLSLITAGYFNKMKGQDSNTDFFLGFNYFDARGELEDFDEFNRQFSLQFNVNHMHNNGFLFDLNGSIGDEESVTLEDGHTIFKGQYVEALIGYDFAKSMESKNLRKILLKAGMGFEHFEDNDLGIENGNYGIVELEAQYKNFNLFGRVEDHENDVLGKNKRNYQVGISFNTSQFRRLLRMLPFASTKGRLGGGGNTGVGFGGGGNTGGGL